MPPAKRKSAGGEQGSSKGARLTNSIKQIAPARVTCPALDKVTEWLLGSDSILVIRSVVRSLVILDIGRPMSHLNVFEASWK